MTAKKATLKRLIAGLNKSDNPLRTDIVEGFFADEPELGRSFRFFSNPLDPKMTGRVVITSAVAELSVDVCAANVTAYTFSTASGSVYELVLEAEAKS